MGNSVFTKLYNAAKSFFSFDTPQIARPFVLTEDKLDGAGEQEAVSSEYTQRIKELRILISTAKRLETSLGQAAKTLDSEPSLKDIERLKGELKIIERLADETNEIGLAYDDAIKLEDRRLSVSIQINKKLLSKLYNLPENKDLVIRDFSISGKETKKSFIAYIEGLADKELLTNAVLLPLMTDSYSSPPVSEENFMEVITTRFLPNSQPKIVTTLKELAGDINRGNTALIIDGSTEAIIVDTGGGEKRSVGAPKIEQSVRGSQAAFVESLRTNTGLIRGILPTSDLITEIYEVGKRIPTNCAIMYLKSIANDQLVQEVRRRIKGISTDFVPDIGVLEQYIEDHPGILIPQTLATERPDRTAAGIVEGRVALLLDGVPFANVVPVNFFAFFQTVEDYALKPPAGSFMRILRLLGSLISVILPSVYLAISYFHQEALPTDMLLAIAGAREKVPFPAIIEIILMEFAFELIREASIRVPGVLGSTIGIVGAIILGQAAVAANLVSPIMVVIIAVTGLASYTLPDYRLAFALRLTRFAFMLSANFFGLVGVALGMLAATVLLCSMKSFGVPFMTPIAPRTIAGLDMVVRGPVFRQERRPDELNTKDVRRQPHISRPWIKDQPAQREDDK